MSSRSRSPETNSSRLHARLAARILQRVREQELKPGEWLSENALATDFGVSRTPVRGALALLADRGIVAVAPRRGYVLKRAIRDKEIESRAMEETAEDRLAAHLAADRFATKLPDLVSEADLMRRYDVSRGLLTRVLGRMAQDGIVERRDGHGWRFLPSIDSEQLHDESYRFRLLVEPAAILEPTFLLDPTRAERVRAAHAELTESGFRRISSVKFFDLNAEFHEFVAASSGNRFLHQAVVNQNRLRRFFSYNWTYGPERMRESCAEHLAILDRLIAGDCEHAAALMRLHLLGASRLSSQFAARADSAEPSR